MTKPIVVDGSIGEGGGQILRTTLGLAAVLGLKVRVVNIRAKRPRPGLQRQHLTAVRAVARLSGGRLKGDELGSTVLEFEPDEIRGGTYRFNIGTAGSTTLVLQAILPILIFSPSPVTVEIRGGTDVPWSPPVDYVRFVLAPLLRLMGVNLEVELVRRGHYPRGGGIIRVRVEKPPRRLNPINLVERGDIVRIEGLSHAVRLPRHVAERQAASARRVLEARYPSVPVSISLEYYEPSRDPHLGPGSGIVLWAVTRYSVLGGDALGAKGKPAEKVGEEAAQKLVEDLDTGKALDRHASDMLIPLLALACGESMVGGARMTLHAYTNIEIVKMLVRDAVIEVVEGGLNKPFVLRVRGACVTT